MGTHSVPEDDWLMDYSKYKSFAPYRGQDVIDALTRLNGQMSHLSGFVKLVSGDIEEADNKAYLDYIVRSFGNVRSYDDFLNNITCGIFVPTILKRTVTEFSVSGIEKLDPDKGYVFISNHRDIILDCALLDYALSKAKLPVCEMAFGDNLIVNSFIEDLFRLNGGIIIRRELPIREKYIESIRISEYFHQLITEVHHSVWVAQKSGRSKDGLDITQPAILKMLFLSQRSSGEKFSDLVREMNVVPVAISYEYDPNDINKGREEVIKKTHDGDYEKKKYEDLISMTKGMKCFKGRVHLSIGEILVDDYENADEAAAAIDKQIHSIYRLWDTNYFAYDYLEGTNTFANETSDFDGDEFLRRFSHLSDDVRLFVLNTYANPVRSALKAKGC